MAFMLIRVNYEPELLQRIIDLVHISISRLCENMLKKVLEANWEPLCLRAGLLLCLARVAVSIFSLLDLLTSACTLLLHIPKTTIVPVLNILGSTCHVGTS